MNAYENEAAGSGHRETDGSVPARFARRCPGRTACASNPVSAENSHERLHLPRHERQPGN